MRRQEEAGRSDSLPVTVPPVDAKMAIRLCG